MIFKGTNRFSPVARKLDLPHERDLFHVKPQEIPTKQNELKSFLRRYTPDIAWWDKQLYRCRMGYTVRGAVDFSGGDVFVDNLNMVVNDDGSRTIPYLNYTINPNGDLWIPGPMYFYLNFWKISIEDKVNKKKSYDHPWFTDLSWENWMIRHLARILEKDEAWEKCRQRGISEEEACETGWIYCFLDDCQVAIVAEEDFYNRNTYNMFRNGLAELYNTQFYRTIKLNNDKVLTSKYTGMEVYSRTANGNAQVLSGLNKLYKVHMEEIGIMREGLSAEIAQFAKSSIKTRGQHRTGLIVYTGTSGIYADGVVDMEKMMYHPEQFDLFEVPNIYDDGVDAGSKIACFIPAWKFRIMDDDGNSLRKESLEDIAEERKKMDPRKRSILIASEPVNTKEMFEISMGGFFGDYVIHHCNEARNLIVSGKRIVPIEIVRLEWKVPSRPWEGVEIIPDPENGDVLIAERPKLDSDGNVVEDLYLQGTDSYDQNEANTSESKLFSGIYKGFNKKSKFGEEEILDNFVAIYLDRPSEQQGGRITAYENTAKLSVLYRCRNMIEYSKIVIFDYYERMGLEGFLALRPDYIIAQLIDRSDVSNKYGFPGQHVLQGLTKLTDWLKVIEHIYNCPFEQVIRAWGKYKRAKGYNCDITIGTMLCIIFLADISIMLEQGTEHQDRPKPLQFKGYRQDSNGVIVEVYA